MTPAQYNGLLAALANVPGVVVPFAGTVTPTGWLVCDGTAVSRTTFAALFAAIGTTWGVGDGATTFNLPDLRGRMPIGVSGGHALGTTGGSETTTINSGNLASHQHKVNTLSGSISATPGNNAVQGVNDASDAQQNTTSTGTGTAFTTVSPFAALSMIIKT